MNRLSPSCGRIGDLDALRRPDAPPVPAGLHHRIMDAIGRDPMPAPAPVHVRHPWLAPAAAFVLLALASGVLFIPRTGRVRAEDREAVQAMLAQLGDAEGHADRVAGFTVGIAASPMHEEMQRIGEDVTGAGEFLLSILPGTRP